MDAPARPRQRAARREGKGDRFVFVRRQRLAKCGSRAAAHRHRGARRTAPAVQRRAALIASADAFARATTSPRNQRRSHGRDDAPHVISRATLIRAGTLALRLVPYPAARVLAILLADICWRLLGERRRTLEQNLLYTA